MSERFFKKDDFESGFGRERSTASDVYKHRVKTGIKEYSLAKFDFIFISDAKDKLTALGKFLAESYSYDIGSITEKNGYWELTGDATEFPVDEENLIYWAVDLYFKGNEFDCKLDGYGAMADPDGQRTPLMTPEMADMYFDQAMDAYNKRNLGMSAIHFSTAIRSNANDPNSWYSRAIVRDELYLKKAARRDYDKAIELAPRFTDAIVNRAANKDAAGEYEDAIVDYDKAIELEPRNEMAYFNRGNSKLNIKDRGGACADWNKAKELGADYAQERIDQHCQSQSFSQKVKGFFKK